MPSLLEQVLAAIFMQIQQAQCATVKREEPLPERVARGWAVILRDGDPGDPDMLPSLLWLRLNLWNGPRARLTTWRCVVPTAPSPDPIR